MNLDLTTLKLAILAANPGLTHAPPSPAIARVAPITRRNSRRPTGSLNSEAPSGNSRSAHFQKSSVSKYSSKVPQKRRGAEPRLVVFEETVPGAFAVCLSEELESIMPASAVLATVV